MMFIPISQKYTLRFRGWAFPFVFVAFRHDQLRADREPGGFGGFSFYFLAKGIIYLPNIVAMSLPLSS